MAETCEQKARLVPLSFTTEGSSHSKRISTDAILALARGSHLYVRGSMSPVEAFATVIKFLIGKKCA